MYLDICSCNICPSDIRPGDNCSSDTCPVNHMSGVIDQILTTRFSKYCKDLANKYIAINTWPQLSMQHLFMQHLSRRHLSR